MATPDERPVLVCRLECPADFLEGLDAWMPKHFDDGLAHPAVTSAANYSVLRDYARLPAVLNGHRNRFIVYAADDSDGLMAWLDSSEARAAIEDGVDRESRYLRLDDEPFTGNIYEIVRVSAPLGSEFAGAAPLVVERFDVPPHLEADFDGWLHGEHFELVAAWPRVSRVRTWRQKREDVPKRFPYTRYTSKGNRMLWVDFQEGPDLRELVATGELSSALLDSVRRDTQLPYVRREACELLLFRVPEDRVVLRSPTGP